jgi:hypothetical protein
MNKLILAIGASLAAGAALAGPPAAAPEPTGSGDGAIILLALIGIVIASSAIGGMATRSSNAMDIDPTDIDEN